MEHQALVSGIEDLGLSNKEARVYLACLTLGPAAVQQIADQAGIKRVTAYVVLESLVGMGLMSQSVKGKKTLFVAEDPVFLRRIVERRAEEVANQQSGLALLLPKLDGLRAIPPEMPEIRMYDGTDSIKVLHDDFYRTYRGTDRELVSFCNVDSLQGFFPESEAEPVNPARIRAGIAVRMIYTSSTGATLPSRSEKALRENRFVPSDQFPVTADMSAIGEYIIMSSLIQSKPVAVTIRNEQMARAVKAIFELAWRSLPKS